MQVRGMARGSSVHRCHGKGAAMRESRLARTLIELTDTLVHGFEVVDLLHVLCERCVDVLEVDAAGVLLADEHGRLRLVAASSEQMRVLEAFEAQHREGPCVDAFQGVSQVVPELADAGDRWPMFAPRALDAGFHSAASFPLRLRLQCIGSLNVFLRAPGTLPETELGAAQALADAATIGILQERTLSESRGLSAQLQQALASRITIEQAKGVTSRALGVDVDQAFDRLRRYSQDKNEPIRDVAQQVVNGTLAPESLTTPRH